MRKRWTLLLTLARASALDECGRDGWPVPSRAHVVDPHRMLPEQAALTIAANLSALDTAHKVRAQLVLMSSAPRVDAAAAEQRGGHARRLLAEWYRDDLRARDRAFLLLVLVDEGVIDYASGRRARRALRDVEARRLVRRARLMLGQRGIEATAPRLVELLAMALRKGRGFFGSFRGLVMPFLMGGVLLYWFMKNQRKTMLFGDEQMREHDPYAPAPPHGSSRRFAPGMRESRGGDVNALLRQMQADGFRLPDGSSSDGSEGSAFDEAARPTLTGLSKLPSSARAPTARRRPPCRKPEPSLRETRPLGVE